MNLSRALDPAPQPPASPQGLTAAGLRPEASVYTNGAAAFFRNPLAPILTVIGVMVLAVLAITFARTTGLVAGLWGASGLAVAVWLRTSRGASYDLCFGALMAVGVAAANLLVGNTQQQTLVFTLANMLDMAGAVVLVRRFAPTLNLASVQGASRFLIAGAVVAPVPGAIVAGVYLWMTTGASLPDSIQTWWFGHALSVAVVGSFGLSLTRREIVGFRRPARVAETIVLLGMLSGLAIMVFSQMRLPLGFLLLPMLLLIAVRLRMVGVTAGLVILTILAIGGSMQGYGPYAASFDGPDRVMMAQLLVLFGYMPVMLVAALLEERDRLSERAKAGQGRAERASAAKSRLLANVAHEIKSPVGGIIGIGELWKSGQLGPINDTQGEMADMLVKTARQVEALSHDLLDVARAESGAVRVEPRPTDVPGVLDDVRRAMTLRPEAEGVRMETVTEGDGLVALADSQRLTQVISNLATNALKYGGSGGVVVFRAARVHDGVRIEVIDRGPGLSLEKQQQLFEPFNRLGLERSTVEGHGIGLALAKRLVELQGGTIGVDSSPAQGATFWVELPAA